MRASLIILCIYFLIGNIFAQKHDNNWLLGGTCTSSEEHRISRLDFENTIQENDVLPDLSLLIHSTNSSISDSNGNLLFYTNGNDIYNWKHELIDNGGNLLNEGDCAFQSLQQGSISLPFPGHDDQYVLITINEEFISVGNEAQVFERVYFNVVEINQNNINGNLLVRQDLILADTLNTGQGMVCQHANGRDWWMLLFEYDSNSYYRFLINPEGINFKNKASTSLPVLSGRNQMSYSPDGKSLAYFNSRGATVGTYIDIFDFDRCFGLLSNQTQILFNDEIPSGAGGIAFSPNSRFLYVSNRLFVYQYDLWASNIKSSRVTIAMYDGYLEDDFWPTTFHLAQLGPNNKIYITTSTDGHYMHVIHNPNEKGLLCNLEQRAIELPTWKRISIPNFPHYRMGALEGSLCDTLGLVNSPYANFEIEKMGTSRAYLFADRSTTDVEEWSWDFGDGNNSNEQNPLHEYDQYGSYDVCLTVSNQAGSNANCQSICVLPDQNITPVIIASSEELDCSDSQSAITLSAGIFDVDFYDSDSWIVSWVGPDDFIVVDTSLVEISQKGTYYLNGVDTVSGCTLSDSIFISESNSELSFELVPPMPILPCGGSIEVQIDIEPGCYIVSWIDEGGNEFEGTDSTIFSFTSDGNYIFKVTDCERDCETSRLLNIELDTITALWEAEKMANTISFESVQRDDVQHSWDFGDGNSAFDADPIHTYISTGIFEVEHIVIGFCGIEIHTEQIEIEGGVFDAPSSGFTYNNQNNDFNFSFEDTSIGEVDAWLWDFGDGNTSSEQNPNHEYAKYGSYEVCLTVTNIVDSDTYCETICVLPDPEQIDLITASDTILNCTNIDDGILLSSNILLSDFYNSEDWLFEWAINGVSASIDNSIQVTTPGFIAFTFRDTSSNCSLSTSIEITEDFTTPDFELSTDLDSIPCGSSFELYIDADTNCFEVVVFYENLTPILFSMDDTLTIDGAGTYTVELRDCSSGCTSTQQFSIENESITAAWITEEMGAEFSFVSDQTSGIDHQWDFGDGGMSEEPNPGHTFTSSGTYQVTHIVSNACGSDTLQQSVNVIISSSKTLAEGSVQVFPNPTSDDLNIRSTVGDIVQVKLYSSLGQVQMDERVQASEVLVSVQDYPAGVYWLHVALLDGRSWTERVVVLGSK